MNARYLKVLLTAPVIGGALGMAVLAGPATSAWAAPATVAQAQAEVTELAPGRLTDSVTDVSGVLSSSDIQAIDDAIRQLQQEKNRHVFVVYIPTFGSYTPEQWATAAVEANGGGSTGVMVISPEERLFWFQGGTDWSQSEIDTVYNAAYPRLAEDDWAGAAIEGLSSVTAGGGSGENAAWLAAGAGAVVVAGGGIWAYSRRNKKKQSAANLADGREIDPSDIRALNQLPTDTLEQLAKDTLVTVDESLRLGQEELTLANNEFGPERTRPFTAAMNSANSALQRAYKIQHRLTDSIPETEPEKRAMLVEIISSAGQADQELGRRSQEFSEMRDLLIQAPDVIHKITQRTVDIRARIEPARATLADLKSRYDDNMLESISDNVDLAVASLDESEKALTTARELEAKPAGQQGALVDVIRTAEHAVEVADHMLESVEHADANIQSAQNNLPALFQEIQDEIDQLGELKGAASSGAQINVEKVEALRQRAAQVLQEAQQISTTDPLTAFTNLTHIDADLDEAIAEVQGIAQDQQRMLSILDQQLNAASAQIQGAEDMIASYGRVIDSKARTLLAEAKHQHASALNDRVRDTRGAIDMARAATETARRAAEAAKNNINQHRQRQAASTFGDVAQGIIIGSMLSGGRGGGGGFGGGGGGFSGGGGGGRGGSF
ncbi:TPM domain-containing protein [Corynebacterium sp. S7]